MTAPWQLTKQMMSDFKDADRFDKAVEVLQAHVSWGEKILLPIGEHLFIVRKDDGGIVTKSTSGFEFGDYRENWKLRVVVYVRDTEESLEEIYPGNRKCDPEWMEGGFLRCQDENPRHRRSPLVGEQTPLRSASTISGLSSVRTSLQHVSRGNPMYSIRKIDAIEKIIHPAVVHQTLVGGKDADSVEVWYQTAKPGKPTPTHYHSGEEIIVVLQGSGWCKIDGEQFEFGPNSVITVPPRTPHQLATTGTEDMVALAILQTPVEIFNAKGEPLPLPWPYGDMPGQLEPTPAE